MVPGSRRYATVTLFTVVQVTVWPLSIVCGASKRAHSCAFKGLAFAVIAHRLGRASSTISRELRRNAATRSGGLDYRATTARMAR